MINKVELRTAVRSHLKVHATNAEIDELFDVFDADRSRLLDLDELGVCLRALQDAAAAAQTELSELTQLIGASRARLAAVHEAAALMRRIEAEQTRQRDAVAAAQAQLPLPLRVGRHLLKARLKVEAAVKRFPEQAPEGYAAKPSFARGVRALGVPGPMDDADLGSWYDAALRECIQASVSRPGGSVKLQLVLSKATSEAAAGASDEANGEHAAAELELWKHMAREQQLAIASAREEQMRLRDEREAAMRQAAEAKHHAEEEARLAKIRSFKRRKSVKEEEVRAFASRVASRRGSRGALDDPLSKFVLSAVQAEDAAAPAADECIW